MRSNDALAAFEPQTSWGTESLGMKGKSRSLDLVLLSDTHELHREVEVPPGDILICAGDFTLFDRSPWAISDFNRWLGELPHRHKIVIYGNHSLAFEAKPELRTVLNNATVLHNEGIEIEGLKIWGSPVTPQTGMAFGMDSAADRARHWAKIPDDTDVLVTHGPPYGVLDQSPGQREHLGDPQLLAAIWHLTKLRLHAFGHIHDAFGLLSQHGTMFANVALSGDDGSLCNRPLRLRLTAVRDLECPA